MRSGPGPEGHRVAAHSTRGGGSDILLRARSARIHCVPRETTAGLLLGEGTSHNRSHNSHLGVPGGSLVGSQGAPDRGRGALKGDPRVSGPRVQGCRGGRWGRRTQFKKPFSFIFQLQLTFDILLVAGVQHSDPHKSGSPRHCTQLPQVIDSSPCAVLCLPATIL